MSFGPEWLPSLESRDLFDAIDVESGYTLTIISDTNNIPGEQLLVDA